MGYIKYVTTPNYVDEYIYEKNYIPPRKIYKARRKRATKATFRSAQSLRRARASFIRIIESNLDRLNPPTLVTLTMHQNLSFATSIRIFTEFVVRLRKRYGKGFKYIAVPEFQKRGALHWHILFFVSRAWLFRTLGQTR